jgi:transposase
MRLACMEDTREELRSAISKLGEMGRGKRYPRPLLEKMLSYTVARRRQGATLVAVGGEIGMNWKTLARWVGERKTASRFERVQVAAPAAAASAALIVHGPRGLRIEGLDVGGVAELVRRLGE